MPVEEVADDKPINDNKVKDLVSVIICVRNSELWLDECLESITTQTYQGPLEVSLFNDGSSDRSVEIIEAWRKKNTDRLFRLVLSSHGDHDNPKGVGFAKNRAVEQSRGEFLCFLDSDDVMWPERVEKQLEMCRAKPEAIVGCRICRIPEDATPRYVSWANSLSPTELCHQIYTCFGPTVLMPTWFCTRTVFDRVGQFDQSKARGTPEDLIFFYRHLQCGGGVARVDQVLLTYRYHLGAATHSVTDQSIWEVRLSELQKHVISGWTRFSIWNAGKEGRRFYRSLTDEERSKVIAFCDVDPKKVNKVYTYENHPRKPRVPIIHYTEVKPPIVICVKLGLYHGQFERNLASLNLSEGIDYVHFG